MEEIGKILPAVLRRHLRAADGRLVLFLAPIWNRVVGPGVGEHSRPIGLEGGTLRLATECSTWATQLRQIVREMVGAVNAFLGGQVVRNIRVEHVPHLKFHRSPQVVGKPAKDPEAKILGGAAGLSDLDPEMARILERSFAKYFARRRYWN